ncbi:hypothetical protein L6V77_32900, partial [Myxococcota bacterium]|nr:hypothetical protein [Myxococcota bacterium]
MADSFAMGRLRRRGGARLAAWLLPLAVVLGLGGSARAQADAFDLALDALSAAPAPTPRERAEVARALSRLSGAAPNARLLDIVPRDPRHAAWRLASGGDPAGLAALLAAAGPDGGFGAGPGHAATALDTAEVLLSAAAAPAASAGIPAAVGALLRTQRPDGGFAANGVDADLPTTALAVRALSAWVGFLPGVQAPRARAVAWLSRAPLGPQPALSEALRADALAAAGALTADGIERLMSLRGPDGRWFDTQGTAAAVRALLAAAPDFAFESVDLAAVEIPAGTPAEALAHLRNGGLTAAPATALLVEVGSGGETQRFDVPALDPGETHAVALRVDTVGRTGGLSVTLRLDPDARVRESDEGNNRHALRLRIRPPAPADLEVRPDLIALDPALPARGTPFRILTTVLNRGDLATPATALRLYRGAPEAGAPLLSAAAVPPIEPGGQVVVTTPVAGLDAQAGRLVALVDPDGLVSETHRLNNRAVRALRIPGGADLGVPGGALALAPGPVVGVDTRVAVRARITNHGDAASPATTIRLSDAGGPPLDERAVPALAPGEVREVELGFTPDAPRLWVLVVEVDPADTLVERDELDNVATTIVESVRYELSVPPGGANDPPTTIRPIETVSIGPTVTNRSSLPIPVWRAAVRLGAPDGPIRGEAACPPLAAAPHGGSVVTLCPVRLSGEGLPVGRQQVFYCVDPGNALAETNEADNCTLWPLVVKTHRDVAVRLDFDPPAPEPGQAVTVHWRLTADASVAGEWAILRVRADGRGLLQRQVSPVSEGQFSWTAPDARGDVTFVATATADVFEEVNPADNRFEHRLTVGGRPRITSAACLGADLASPAVAGRAGRLRIAVDAPTAVTFGGTTLPARPDAPAVFPYTPAVPGETTLLLSTTERPAPAGWPCEARRAGAPGGLTAEPVPEGVRLAWAPVPGATAYEVLRDGAPVGAPVRALVPSIGLPAGARVRPATHAIEFARSEWVGAVAMDMAAHHRSVLVRWRLEAQADDGAWVALHEETSQRPGSPARTWAPVRARRLRLVLPEPTSAAVLPGMTLSGFPSIPETTVTDDRVGAEPASYRVTALFDAVRSEDSAPLLVDRPLEGPVVDVSTLDGAVHLTVADPPGERVGGFLVEIDGQPDPDEALTATAQWPVGLTGADLPWAFAAQGPDDVPTERRARAVFSPPRPISSLPALVAAPEWLAIHDDGRPFAPGVTGALTFVRPAVDGESPANSTFAPSFRGPPLLDARGGLAVRRLADGAHAVAVIPLDHAGRRGVATLLNVQSSGPRGLSDVTATPNGPFVHLTWTAPAEVETVDVEADWGEVLPRAARPGVFDVVPPHLGFVTFRLVPRDAAGHPGPASTVSLDFRDDLPRPENLRVTVTGFQVSATWTLPRVGASSGFHVRVDDEANPRSVAQPAWQGQVTRAGRHTLRVAAAHRDGTNEGPAAEAAFDIADDGPPPPPVLRPLAEWTLMPLAFTARFDRLVLADLAAMDIRLNAEPALLEVPAGGFATVVTRPGVRFYDAAFRHRDTTGNASAWVETRFEMPAAPAPTLTAGPLRADGVVPLSLSGGVPGHFIDRDGSRLCNWVAQGGVRGGLVSMSSGTLDINAVPFGAVIPQAPWVPSPADPQPTLEFELPGGGSNLGVYIDRVRLHFRTPDGVARSFHLDARPVGLPWREVARVQHNDRQEVVLDLPESPRVAGRGFRLVFDDGPRPAQIQLDHLLFETCAAPATDVPPGGGRFTYRARAWSAYGDPGPFSAPTALDVPLTDLVAEPGSLRLTTDELLVGETVAVVAPVRNAGSRDAAGVDVAFSVAARACDQAPRELGRARIDVPAGGATAAVFAWPVSEDAGVLCVTVDPENRVPEAVENNNRASRAIGPDLPYRAVAWSNLGVAVLPCGEALRYVLRPTDGGAAVTGALLPGEAAWHALTGPLSVSADRRFALHVGERNGPTSLSLRDCDGGLLGRHLVGDVPTSAPGVAAVSPGIVIYAPEADASVIGSEPFRWNGARGVASGVELFTGDVPAGALRAFNPHTRADGQRTHSLRLEVDAPVAAWSYSDLGFAFVSPDGRMTGRDLFGFVAGASTQFQGAGGLRGEEIALVSYDPDNRVELVRTDTDEVVYTAVLPAGALASHVFAQDPPFDFIPLRVRSTGRTAALNMRLVESPAFGYMHAFYVPGASGLILDRDFVVPATGNCRGATTAVLALYDGTAIRVRHPDTGAALYETTLGALQATNLAAEVALLRDGVERRLLVETDRPVSIYHACDTAGAEMAPVLFDPAFRPDLRVTGVFTAPEMPLPGDVLHIHGEVRNEGVVRARDARLRVFDGEPAAGRLLYEGVLPRLDAGQPAAVDFELGVGEGQRVLVWIVDPEDAVEETDEGNNRTDFAIANPPDLVPLPARGSLVAGREGTLTLDVRNDGGQAVVDARLRVFADDVLLGAVALDVPPVGTATVDFPWRPTAPGPVEILVEAVAPAAVIEARTDNNRALARLAVAADLPDLTARVEVRPAAPVEDETVQIDVVVEPAAAVTVALLAGDARLDAVRTAPDGTGLLRWIGPKAAGPHALTLVVDENDEIAESDEGNNRVPVLVDVAAPGISLTVAGPDAPVSPGAAVRLTVTPDAPLPADSVITAPGFAPAPADGAASVVLSGTADETPGPVEVPVAAWVVDTLVARGSGTYTVAPARPEVALRLRPVVAAPGEPVTLEAAVRGAGVLRFTVDDVLVAESAAVGVRSVHHAVQVDDRLGPHTVRIALLDAADGTPLATAEGAFERVAAPPYVTVDVSVGDQTATVGETLSVPVVLSALALAQPVEVDDVVLALTDEPPTRVVQSVALGAPVVVGAAPVEVGLTLGPLPWRPGPWRLVARAEAAGRRLGLGTARLTLLDSDAEPPPDAAPPVPDAAPPVPD